MRGFTGMISLELGSLERAKKAGWEGIIAKRRSSVYELRRSKEWLKIKAINEQELIVVGWNPSTASDREIGSLHLAVRRRRRRHSP